MASLADKAILSGADNRPPMLEKDMYDSWKSRMKLYMLNRQHGMMIFESVEHGPLLWPTVEEDGSAQTVHMLTKPQVFYNHATRQALGFQNPRYLKKAQQLKPNLYDGSVIGKYDVIVVPDSENTLLYAEESRSKMIAKQNDPQLIEKKVITKPIDYATLNQLSTDFNTRFVPQTESYAEQAFWSQYSVQTDEPTHSGTAIVEVPKELPKVSMVNSCLKKLKYHLASFDVVVKEPTTATAIIEGTWGFEHTKACFRDDIIPFVKNLKDLFTSFDQYLIDEVKYSPPETRLVVPIFQKGDDPIDAINHMMSFLTTVVTSRYLATNNQLRTSSNPRQQATINNGRVTIQPIQGRQNFVSADSSRPFTSGSGGAPGKKRVIVCYNCKGEGHMSKKGTKPKRKRDAEWFKDTELFTLFDQYLIEEVTKVQNVFKQMELAVEQYREEKHKFQNKMEHALQENDRLLTQALSVEIVNVVVNDNSDASEGFNQVIDFLNGSYIKYALTINPHIYVSCIKQFWNTVVVKQSNDVTRLQALVDKNKVVIMEATIRDHLRLDDAEGVDCLPNEEFFDELACMGYEKPLTKLTFYKAFFSSQWKFLIHTILQSLSAKRTSWNKFSSSMASAVICLSTGADTVVQGDDIHELSIPSPTLPTPPLQTSQDIPSTSQLSAINLCLTISSPLILLDLTMSIWSFKHYSKSSQQEIIREVVWLCVENLSLTKLHNDSKSSLSKFSSKVRKLTYSWDPKEESTTIIHVDTKSKDMGKGIMVEEPKPLKKKQQVEMDEEYARKLHEELNKDIDCNVAIDHVKQKAKEDPFVQRYQVMKKRPHTEAQARRNMIMYLKNVAGFRLDYFKGIAARGGRDQSHTKHKLDSSSKSSQEEEVEDLKKHLEIVSDEDDDVYTEATPLARKVPVVDYEIIHLNNKPHYKIIQADGIHQLLESSQEEEVE
nr:hypothetical protein [Tanacetum cinerariifolium]